MMNVIAWGQAVPWAEMRQVEQDLIISRAIVEIFSDPILQQELRFRGGTALNKLHFPEPIRYSEDIDLVRTSHGPIGPILNRLRELLEPWLGNAAFDQSPTAPKLRFRVPAEDQSAASQIRLKVEINTREAEAYDPPQAIHLRVENPWFSGAAEVATFTREEILATKLRALLQRNKGRDLFDLAHAIDVFEGLDRERVIACFSRYLQASNVQISRAEAEQRMFAKLRNPAFLADLRPLLSADHAASLNDATTRALFIKVFDGLITHIPGEPWARSKEVGEGLSLRL